MADFYQNGIVTTLHNLSERPVEELEKELVEFSKKRPMALILPRTVQTCPKIFWCLTAKSPYFVE
jgi:hypothetical protein